MPTEKLTLLYSRAEITDRVGELAREINRDYPHRELVVIGILKGVFVFLADLIRDLAMPVVVDFVGLSSYGLGSESSHQISMTKDLQVSIGGKDVLVVEDILDTGLSVEFVLRMVREQKPASVRLCVLIDKEERRMVPVTAEYVGFKLARGFIVGYGIDYAERYRHLPEIYRLELKGPS